MAEIVMHVIWSPKAADDLRRIILYIMQHNPHAAQLVAHTIYGGCTTLAQFPYRHRKSRVSRNYDLIFPNLPYIAVYRVRLQKVEIVRIYHTAQNWP